MRTRKKRRWAELLISMTPLIDVVFLINIFFIITINFSEMHIRNVDLPKADQARNIGMEPGTKIPVTIKSSNTVFLDRKEINRKDLVNLIKIQYPNPKDLIVQIRADENITYDIIKETMLQLAQAHIYKIEFATLRDTPIPLEKAEDNET